MSKRILHICLSIDGALKNWDRHTWQAVARDNKTSVLELKQKFKIYQFEGKKVIPIGEPCEGFSYIDGCPGHPIGDS